MERDNTEIQYAEEIEIKEKHPPKLETDKEIDEIADVHKRQGTSKKRLKTFAASAWDYIKFAKIELIIIFAAIFLDLITKFFIGKNMYEGEEVVIIKNFLQFRYVLNDRAAFGSGFGLEKIFGEDGVITAFIVFSIVTIAVFCYLLYRFRKSGKFVRICISLIIGGAFGNLYDRIAFGHVRDFVEIVFFGLDVPFLGKTFAIFNIADSALVVGMIMLMVYILLIYKDPQKTKKETEINQEAD